VSRVALVTGGAVRLGRALSLGLAEAGFNVVIHYHSSEAAARDVARRVEALGRRAVTVGADIRDPDQIRELAEAVEQSFGRLDVLVNSAASFREGSFGDIDADEWDEVLAVNLRGPFLLVQHLAPLLSEGGGTVVNLVDLSALETWVGRPHHAVSKAALLHLTRVMARALAPAVRVNAIAPGTVLPPSDYDAEALERERMRTLLRTLGSPEDIVRTTLFLVESPFMTGEVITVDGGRSIDRPG
jgi:pteridine reductase